MRSPVLQRVLNDAAKQPWWVKLARWYRYVLFYRFRK
jgi:hypothetical protein